MKQVQAIVCWACKKGGEEGPLRKVGKHDYAHKQCSSVPPTIQNQSFLNENRLEAKDIRIMLQQAKEAND